MAIFISEEQRELARKAEEWKRRQEETRYKNERILKQIFGSTDEAARVCERLKETDETLL